MNVESVSNAVPTQSTSRSAPEQVESQRKNAEKVANTPQASAAEDPSQVQPEELLDQIKSLTEDGLYSVRFETNDNSELVVKIWDNEAKEVIRQIPPEEMLNFRATFNDLLGNIVNTEG